MHTVMDWVQVILLAAWIVLTLIGFVSESKEQNELRDEIELINERMDRAGLPDRLPVHVVTTLAPEADADPDGTGTALMPVVGRHRIDRRGEVAPYEPVVVLDD